MNYEQKKNQLIQKINQYKDEVNSLEKELHQNREIEELEKKLSDLEDQKIKLKNQIEGRVVSDCSCLKPDIDNWAFTSPMKIRKIYL